LREQPRYSVAIRIKMVALAHLWKTEQPDCLMVPYNAPGGRRLPAAVD
jgi:hypothetical protein